MNNIIKNATIFIVAMVLCVIGTSTTLAEDNENSMSSELVVPVAATSAKVSHLETKVSTTKPITSYTAYIKTGKVKIYSKASSKSKVVKTLHKGQKVTVIKKSGNWRQIGKKMWVNKDKLCSKDPMGSYNGIKLKYYGNYSITKNKLTRSKGVVYYNGHKETWYSSNEYGQTQTAYSIPGKHIAKDGTYRDKDGYICIAANYLKKGKTIMTSLGPAKVYDTGGMSGQWIDIYTNW